MKKSLVQTLVQGDNTFGQVSNPNDLMKAQGFAHDRVSSLTNDFVNNSETPEIKGFEYELGDFAIDIQRPGRIYTQNGISYDQLADVTLDFETADADLPRIDLIVAKIEDELESELDLIPFVRLRTADEFDDAVGPYPPANISAPTEIHWRAVPGLKTGTPGDTPAVPAYAVNEIPLYMVLVGPGVTQINASDIVDLRNEAWTIRRLNEETGGNIRSIAQLLARVAHLEDLAGQPIDLSQIFGQIRTLGEILADFERRISASNDLPEVRYDNPKFDLTDPRTSKILAAGNPTLSDPMVDIEVGARVNFGDSEFTLEPRNFADQSLNPRYETVDGAPVEHFKREVALTIDNVTPIGSNGFVDFLERAAILAAKRSRPGVAARDDRYVEIFGGLASDNASALGDWITYDTENDTLTPRAPLAALPNSDRPFLVPYGDDTHVLLIAGSSSDSTPQVFKLHAGTGAVTEIMTTKPTGVQFFGDLIAPGKMLIVAVRAVGPNYENDFWEFDTGTNLFTELGVTGDVPEAKLDSGGGCYYRLNQFVMVSFDPKVASSGSTYIFDRLSLQWTRLAIAPPFKLSSDRQAPIGGFRMANVNGRPLLVGGDLSKDVDLSLGKVWELKATSLLQLSARPTIGLEWASSDATFPRLLDAAFCSTIGTSGLPDTKAFMVGGFIGVRKANNRIYASVQAGLISTVYGGIDGITIAPSSTSVQFEVEPFTADWSVAAFMANLNGRFTDSNVIVEASFNDGDAWHQVTPGRTFEPTDSDDPAILRIRVTMYNGLTPPILTRLIEVLDTDGVELEDRVVLRFDFAYGSGTKGLYMDRLGRITLESAIVPSVPGKAILMKIVSEDTPAPPTVEKCYINKRRPHIKYSETNSGLTVSTQFVNELAVPIRYIDTRVRRGTDDVLYAIDNPTVVFDGPTINIAGTDEGDTWLVELDG